MTVQLMWATPEADKQIAFMARVSNPDNQDNAEFRILLYLNKQAWQGLCLECKVF